MWLALGTFVLLGYPISFMVLTGHFLFFLKFRKCPTDTLWFAHLFILPDSL